MPDIEHTMMNQRPHAQTLSHLLETERCILTEGAVVERIRRSGTTSLDPVLVHASFVYTAEGRRTLTALHNQYFAIGRRYDLPMLTLTDTWRANAERLAASPLRGIDVNGDCVRFLREIAQGHGPYAGKILLGGLIGCKGDAYRPEEALSEQEARSFHAFQVDALAAAGVDFLFASTMPALPEAAGVAAAMASSGMPYVISFVLNRAGAILDNTPLDSAIAFIDGRGFPPPLFYMANCCHPSYYRAGMTKIADRDPGTLQRIIGLQANTSAKDAQERDALAFLDSEAPDVFADAMMSIRDDFGARVLGGCCGSDDRHIAAIAKRIRTRAKN